MRGRCVRPLVRRAPTEGVSPYSPRLAVKGPNDARQRVLASLVGRTASSSRRAHAPDLSSDAFAPNLKAGTCQPRRPDRPLPH